MFRARHITVVLVAVLGAGLAWWGVPIWRQMQAIRATGDADAARRAAAWSALMDGAPPAGITQLDAILDRLETAPDDALLDAADRLGPHGAWTWDRVPRHLVLRELATRVTLDDPVDLAPAVERLEIAPLDLAADQVIPLFDALLAADDATLRHRALDAACAWAGPDRGAALGALDIDDPALRRTWRLALAFTDRPDLGADFHPPDTPRAELEACLVAAARDEFDLRQMLRSRVYMDGDRVPWGVILRGIDDPDARSLLKGAATQGDITAGYVLKAAEPEKARAVARRVATDPGEPPWRRRLAAWRVPGLEPDRLDAVLAQPVADPDGSVLSAALLAERLPDATDRAEAWIRDFDDDRKRAGAILAALLDTHRPLLEASLAVEDRPEVRTVQHVALAAADRDADALEVAHRASPNPDGGPPVDLLACLLIGGRDEALDWITRPPPDDWRDPATTMRHRSMLVERFVPRWHAMLGRLVGGDVESMRLQLEMLRALATLERRRLRFDAATRTFVEATPEEKEVAGRR